MKRRCARLHPGAVLALSGALLPGGVLAQAPQAAVLGDTIRVGDVVPVAVRLIVERGERVVWPDTLPLGDAEVENAARVRERVDTLPDGRMEITALYAVTPWRPGEAVLPNLAIGVVTGQEAVQTRTAALPPFEVVSVLPADTTGVEPRPARSVVGRNWPLWPFLLGVLLLLALLAAIAWWLWRRRRALATTPAPAAAPPRERALAALREARDAGLLERGEMKEFYTRTAAAVRHYLADLEAAWSDDLTTSELLAGFRAQLGPSDASRLGEVLTPADQVKFARRRPDALTAEAEWERAVGWVESFSWPPRTSEHGRAA